ncbi:uncharacterized protein LOC126187384 [Schistocerca cancellata]|uniref:uncharacterized protein LOC126187384 n=1 Tax=Schistocerca cancellata TaxID=274614 RepID=UPI002118C20D|nr:uncharacterized protein LOC126187384 [Schistocerca cancellata]
MMEVVVLLCLFAVGLANPTEQLQVAAAREAAEVHRAKRCANLWDDSCLNDVSGASDDGDYFGSGNSPGKRWAPQEVRHLLEQMGRQAAAKRCANLWDDSCANGGFIGASEDGQYFGSGNSPGKRSLSQQLRRLQLLRARAGSKRCANLWDDSCANGGVDGASDDGHYFDSDQSPGK